MPDVEYLSYDVVAERGWSAHETEAFEAAAEADLNEADYGHIEVHDGETLLDAAERAGLDWSLKCLGGRCGRCSAVVVDGDVDMDAEQEFLTREDVDERDLCLPCVSEPETDLALVCGARELDAIEDRVK